MAAINHEARQRRQPRHPRGLAHYRRGLTQAEVASRWALPASRRTGSSPRNENGAVKVPRFDGDIAECVVLEQELAAALG